MAKMTFHLSLRRRFSFGLYRILVNGDSYGALDLGYFTFMWGHP